MLKPVANPPNPFLHYNVEWLDVPPHAELEVFEETARTIVTENESPDIPFRYSVNPYRGCFHACAYCYARPYHHYLDFGAGSDFERKIVVKINAAEKLRECLARRNWRGEGIVFSGVTDCYQPLEACYQLTRNCLKACVDFKNPVSIITKGALIRRDIDLLQQLHRLADVNVYISLAFSDDGLSKAIEPNAPRPSTRLRVIRELTAAGIPVGVGLAPIIIGLNDDQVPQILQQAKESGATRAFYTLLRLPGAVEDVFIERLRSAMPQRVDKVLNGLRSVKGGKLNRGEFGRRMSGEGPRWEAIKWLFRNTCAELGLNTKAEAAGPAKQQPSPKQLQLF